jgi:hypothetical protein
LITAACAEEKVGDEGVDTGVVGIVDFWAAGLLPSPDEQPARITAPTQAPIAAPLNLTAVTRRLLRCGASPRHEKDASGGNAAITAGKDIPPLE